MNHTTIKYDRLPAHMQDGARLYVEHGVPPGGFLAAVLSNNMMDAFARADSANAAAMKEWAMWMRNDAPRGCWGSQSIVEDWVDRGGLGAEPDVSGCCAAEILQPDICSQCREHCEPMREVIHD